MHIRERPLAKRSKSIEKNSGGFGLVLLEAYYPLSVSEFTWLLNGQDTVFTGRIARYRHSYGRIAYRMQYFMDVCMACAQRSIQLLTMCSLRNRGRLLPTVSNYRKYLVGSATVSMNMRNVRVRIQL